MAGSTKLYPKPRGRFRGAFFALFPPFEFLPDKSSDQSPCSIARISFSLETMSKLGHQMNTSHFGSRSHPHSGSIWQE
jgi:hypothetical protein